MYIPKRYGESKVDNCPFCGRISIMKNAQGVPVCAAHKSENLTDLKCVCGEMLEMNDGKFGIYFKCINCGNMNLRKAIEVNPQIKASTASSTVSNANSQMAKINAKTADVTSSKTADSEETCSYANNYTNNSQRNGVRTITSRREEFEDGNDDFGKKSNNKKPREMTITSDELDFL
ncbi:MAG: hypothetical protein Q8O89_01660 [Nanoarchaeota archaeon]|nr:hypothetical protein [Nanoarchaeota archaeon]